MINNLEGLIWTAEGMMVFCISEKSDDNFEIVSSGLGAKEGFCIEDGITSARQEKTWFVNTVDGLLYYISWKEYHDMIEDWEEAQKDSEMKETLNLVTCSEKHSIQPVNIHYMLNYTLEPQIGSFRINQSENLLAFTAQTNKIIVLSDLKSDNPRAYTTIFLEREDTIKDFQFLEDKKIIVLIESGYLKVFNLKKRVSVLSDTLDLFQHLDEKSKMNPHLQVDQLSICKRANFIVVSTSTSNNKAGYKLLVFKREIAASNKSTDRIVSLATKRGNKLQVPFPPSPRKLKKKIVFKYHLDDPNKGVPSSAIGCKLFDSYILDNPIMFSFSSNP